MIELMTQLFKRSWTSTLHFVTLKKLIQPVRYATFLSHTIMKNRLALKHFGDMGFEGIRFYFWKMFIPGRKFVLVSRNVSRKPSKWDKSVRYAIWNGPYICIYIRVFIAELYSRERLKISTKFLLQVVIHPFACVVKYVRKFWEVRVTWLWSRDWSKLS